MVVPAEERARADVAEAAGRLGLALGHAAEKWGAEAMVVTRVVAVEEEEEVEVAAVEGEPGVVNRAGAIPLG